jgi:hypothetical protein
MTFGHAVDDIGEIDFWIETVELGGLQNGIEHGCAFSAGIGAEEQEVFSGNGDIAQRSLGWIIVDADAPVSGIKRERLPARQCVLQGLGQVAF